MTPPGSFSDLSTQTEEPTHNDGSNLGLLLLIQKGNHRTWSAGS